MFIKTPRLLLRPPWPEDAPAIKAAIDDWDIVSNLSRAPWPYTLDDAETFIRVMTDGAACGHEHCLMITLLPGARLIGAAGLLRHDQDSWEIGYWLAKPFWGRGLATEAANALVATAFESLQAQRLIGGHYVDNPASGRVQAKLGFRPWRQVERYCAAREAEVLTQELALTRAQWQAHTGHNQPQAARAA